MERADSNTDSPGTPQKGDIVDKLLRKLLAKQDCLEAHHDISNTATAGAAGGSYHPDHHNEDPQVSEARSSRTDRLIRQLATAKESLKASSSSGTAPSLDATCRIAALESKVYQLETDTVAAVAARRRAEQDLAAAKAQVTSVTKSLALQKSDWQQAADFLRSQLESKSQECSRNEHQAKKLAQELEVSCHESEKQQEHAQAVQRQLRERITTLERQAEESRERLRSAESRASTLETNKRLINEYKSTVDEENSRLRHQLESSRRDVGALREELAAAREQLESALTRATGSRDLEDSYREALTQRAGLVAENRSMRAEVGRLQAALLDEKASKDQLKQNFEMKLATAVHELTGMKSKLELKNDEIKVHKAQVTTLKADLERAVEMYEDKMQALKDKLAENRKLVEDTRRKAAEQLELAESRWEERTAAAIEHAVVRHQKRIQDLEMQLMHVTGNPATGAVHIPTSGGRCASSLFTLKEGQNSVPGGFASSILDYIPRSEHIRLMEIRTATKDAEMMAEIACARSTALSEGQAKIAAVNEQLQETREELQKAVLNGMEYKDNAARAEHALVMLRAQCDGLGKELERATLQASEATAKVAQLEKELKLQHIELEKFKREADEALKAEVRRGDKACAGLEEAVAAAKAAEEAAKSLELQRLELENAEKKNKKVIAALERDLQRLKAQLSQAEGTAVESNRTATAAAERAQSLQERCAAVEAEKLTLICQIENLVKELEQQKAAILSSREEATRKNQTDLAALLLQIERALGLVTPFDQSQLVQFATLETRTELILSKCRQLQAEAAAALLASQRANDLQARYAALEQHYLAIQQQYTADMTALEKLSRDQVQGVKSEAEEVLAGLRRASTLLHQQTQSNIGVNGGAAVTVTRGGSLASEVEELKIRLAQQAQQAAVVEKREEAFAALLSQLTDKLTNNGSSGMTGVAGETLEKKKA